MPTYEYECKKCSYSFEVFQAMSDEPLKKCPKCGKELRRLIFGGTGVIFKGSGFYVTDKASGKSAGIGKGHTENAESTSDSTPAASPASTTDSPQPSSPAAADSGVSGNSGHKTKPSVKSA